MTGYKVDKHCHGLCPVCKGTPAGVELFGEQAGKVRLRDHSWDLTKPARHCDGSGEVVDILRRKP